MSKKSFTILLAATAVAVVLAVVAMLGQPRIEASDRQGEPVLPALIAQADKLKSIIIRQGGKTLSLDWDGKYWRAREYKNYPANDQEIRRFLISLGRMTKIEGKTKLPERYARLEVEDPGTDPASKSRHVSLIDTQGNVIGSIILGKPQYGADAKGTNTYVRIPGDPQAWLASGDAGGPGTELSDWLERKIADVPTAAITRVTVTHPDGDNVVAQREAGAPNMVIAGLSKAQQAATAPDADQYAGLLNSLTFDEVVDEAEKPFAKGETTTAVIEGPAGFQVTLQWSQIDRLDWIKLKASAPANSSDANVVNLGADWKAVAADINTRAVGRAFQVRPYQIESLRHRLKDLMTKPPAPAFTGNPFNADQP